jgi:hypothetical protein
MNLKSKILTKKNIFYLLRYLILALIIILIIELLKYILNVKDPDSNKLKDAFLSNFFFSFVGTVLIAPILEEVVFRLSLKKNNYYWFSVFLSLIFVLSSKFILTQVICSLFIGSLILYQFNVKIYLTRFFLIVLSVLAFLTAHFDNYNENELKILGNLDFVMLFIPQFILALILTKIRLQTCFLNSVIFHSLYNFFILSLALLFNY